MAFDPIKHFQEFDFLSCRNLLVAVSGGSDSVGLLCALNSYLSSLPAGPLLSAVTVDHALREGSKAEASAVGALCASLNIPHFVKLWHGAKPVTGIQAAARHERRALLAQCATEVGADVIFTGHTLDDQIETVMMRQRRGSGPGLAGIASASLAYDDRSDGTPVWIMRPLLGVGRQDIRAYLKAQGISWIDDPSNNNPAFERIAVRSELQIASDNLRHSLVLASNNAAEKRETLAFAAGDLFFRYVQEVAPGLVHIDPEVFMSTNTPAACVLLRTLIAFAGGASSLGDGQIAEEIYKRGVVFDFSRGAKPWRETSNGALIEIRQSGVYMLREGRKKRRNDIQFDGRYRTTEATRKQGLHKPNVSDVPVPASLVRRASDLEPQYSVDAAVTLTAFEASGLGYPLRRLINPWPDLVPLFDLALAKKLNVLAGAVALPDTPVYFHGKK